MANIRDGFGASTGWMNAGSLSVGTESVGARRLLQSVDKFHKSVAKLQESLDLADYSQTNKLSSSISILADTQNANSGGARRLLKSGDVCMGQKEVLLAMSYEAAGRAIKTSGFICEMLSSVRTISNSVDCINTNATATLSAIAKILASSTNAESLALECSQNIVQVLSTALGAVHRRRQCIDGTSLAQNTIEMLDVGALLSDMDSSMQNVLDKASKTLIVGQSAQAERSNSTLSSDFIVKKVSPSTAQFSGALTALRYAGGPISFDIPSTVRQDARIRDHSDVSALFSAMTQPPVMGNVTPISPVVTLTLAAHDGTTIDMRNLNDKIRIRIPISNDNLCSKEHALYTGRGRCLHWSEVEQRYSPEGCTTTQSESGDYVDCYCNHLTSFVVENEQDLCGSSFRFGEEGCDDGNVASNDGCSDSCQVECGFACLERVPDQCISTCGDGVRAGDEACDDGNTVSDDGCSPTCTLEPGYSCDLTACQMSLCSPVCGDGVRTSEEACDDGNSIDGDGCSSACAVECGYYCNLAAEPNVCTTECGDGILAGDEVCDDAGASEGCLDDCSGEEHGWVCVDTACTVSVCDEECGNGIRTSSEACDDGNSVSGDGCSATCTVECGYSCTATEPNVCSSSCGDGVRAGNEACDDNNLVAGDGCSGSCTVELTHACSQAACGRTQCVSSSGDETCGDGILSGAETIYEDYCDDGDTDQGDGCSAICTIECGYTCTSGTASSASSCNTVCGDGLKAGAEGCDDGNTESGDGCGAGCEIEDGFICTGLACSSSTCTAKCGDGLQTSQETCDDGNTESNDGCSSACEVECGYSCTAGVCQSTCGDGARAGDEACDDGNTVNGDGCSAQCAVEGAESGIWCNVTQCQTICLPIVCGDGMRMPSEACDDGNTISGDGCSASCAIECGFNCTGSSPDACTSTCGDGVLSEDEACDDGNFANGDGCSGICTVESAYACAQTMCGESSCSVEAAILRAEVSHDSIVPGANGTFEVSVRANLPAALFPLMLPLPD